MQDEVAKHTKKLYDAVKQPGAGVAEKVKEVAIEIFIIVFAVTLSIWLHNWSDHRHEQKETAEFLQGLKADLTLDLRQLHANKEVSLKLDSNYTRLTKLITTKAIDTVPGHNIGEMYNFDMNATHPNIGRYDGFKASGKIGTIEDDSLKQAILVYYQQTMPAVADVEEVVNDIEHQLLNAELDGFDHMSMVDLSKTYKIEGLCQYLTQNLDGELKAYTDAETQAKKIIARIGQAVRDK
jgi:hypothetical protein